MNPFLFNFNFIPYILNLWSERTTSPPWTLYYFTSTLLLTDWLFDRKRQPLLHERKQSLLPNGYCSLPIPHVSPGFPQGKVFRQNSAVEWWQSCNSKPTRCFSPCRLRSRNPCRSIDKNCKYLRFIFKALRQIYYLPSEVKISKIWSSIY